MFQISVTSKGIKSFVYLIVMFQISVTSKGIKSFVYLIVMFQISVTSKGIKSFVYLIVILAHFVLFVSFTLRLSTIFRKKMVINHHFHLHRIPSERGTSNKFVTRPFSTKKVE